MDLAALTLLITQTIVKHRVELRKLLLPSWGEVNSSDNPLLGFCYFATEALYFLGGGKDAGLTPCVMRIDGGFTHWWVRGPDGTPYDPTAGQFPELPDYSTGRGCGFQTGNEKPSKRAQVLIDLVLEAARRGRS